MSVLQTGSFGLARRAAGLPAPHAEPGYVATRHNDMVRVSASPEQFSNDHSDYPVPLYIEIQRVRGR